MSEGSEQFDNWGDFFWPGRIDECRRNLLDEHDPARLEVAERNRVAARMVELRAEPHLVKHTFDLDHVQAIHRHLFQDVYAWAGQLRPVDLVRPSADPNEPPHQFVEPENIPRLAAVVFEQLDDPAQLRSVSLDEAAEKLGSVYNGLNVLHPFVEGNGRTNREFLTQAADRARLQLDWSQMVDQNEIMAEAFTLGPAPVVASLRECLSRPQLEDDVRQARDRALDGIQPRTRPTPSNAPRRGVNRGPEPARGRGGEELER